MRVKKSVPDISGKKSAKIQTLSMGPFRRWKLIRVHSKELNSPKDNQGGTANLKIQTK